MTRIVSSLLVSIALLACGDSEKPSPGPDAASSASIAALAQATPSLSTLVAAATFASDNGDIVQLLSDPGTLTVFAPTNDAFDALAIELTGNASAKGADLLTPANKPLLRTVLQYHVLTAKVEAAMIPFGHAITASEGDFFKIDAGSPPVITDGRNRTAKITMTDIAASNGVIHTIDHVILPADKNIVELAQSLAAGSQPQFTVLVAAVTAAGLDTTLSGPGPFTVFAPTDQAFASLLAELGVTKEQLLANKPLLTSVLGYHALGGLVLKADVPVGTPIATVNGANFTVDSSLNITDARGRVAKIVATDTLAKNGVVHVIDKVLLPPQ